MTSQLTLDGGEVPHPPPRWHARTEAQRDVLDLATRPEGVKAWEAGRILHEQRDSGCCWIGAKADRCKATKRMKACCPYGASDGADAIKRLAARGLLQRGPDRAWRLRVRTWGSVDEQAVGLRLSDHQQDQRDDQAHEADDGDGAARHETRADASGPD